MGNKPWRKINLRSKEFPPNDDEGDVGGLNCTFCPMKPLITMYILNLG
jgi:hypothetical protein